MTTFDTIDDYAYVAFDAIPKFGTLYSFRRAVSKTIHGDGQAAWVAAVDAAEGAIRDFVLPNYLGTELHAKILIVHASVSAMSDKLVMDIYKYFESKRNTRASSFESVTKKNAWGEDCDLVFIPGNVEPDKPPDHTTIKKLLKHYNLALSTFGQVYHGRLNYNSRGFWYAENENFWMIFPRGIHGPIKRPKKDSKPERSQLSAYCCVFSTFTQGAAEEQNRPLTQVWMPIASYKNGVFIAKGKQEYYNFKGTVTEQGRYIKLEMYNPENEYIAEIAVERTSKIFFNE
jgi:hypothetical protein